jgi:hypothetical protein
MWSKKDTGYLYKALVVVLRAGNVTDAVPQHQVTTGATCGQAWRGTSSYSRIVVALGACGRPEALWSPAVVRSRMRRRHNAFRIGPAIRRSIESDCFSLDQIIVFFSPAI